MGDRSNIAIVQNDNTRIYLYGHWMGMDCFTITRDVLARKLRWNDGPYLARMLFSEMTKDAYDEETGFGISNIICDNEYPIIVVDPQSQTVWCEFGTKQSEFRHITNAISFEEFSQLADGWFEVLTRQQFDMMYPDLV